MSKMNPSITQESLPKGWMVKTSRSQKGKEYFCNPSRKISLWSLPEVLAFERGLCQLENTSLSSKFKPVISAADPKGKRPGAEGASQPTVSTNTSCLKPREKPFKMVLKATRKLSQTNSTLKDCIAEAAALCSFSGSSRKTGTSGKLSSGSALTQSSPVKDVIEKRKDGTPSPAGRDLKSPKGRMASKRTLSSINKEEGTMDTQVKAGNSQEKVAGDIHPSQLGCSASKLWGKLFPGKVAKTSSKAAKETTSESAGIQENQINERLKAINSRIGIQLNASKWNRASAKAQPATGMAQGTPASPTNHDSPSLSLRQAMGATSKADKCAPAKQKPQQDGKSSRTHPQTDAEETDSRPCPSAAASASALAKPTSTCRARKKLRTSPIASSGPQLYDHIPLPTARATKKQNNSPGIVCQPLTQQMGTSLKHYTIPKRSSTSVPPADPAAATIPRPVDPSLVPPAPPPLPPSSPPPLPPLPPPPLPLLPPPPPPPPPCQPDAVAPVAVVPPFVPSVDTSAPYSVVAAASGASADLAASVPPSWSDWLGDGPPWSDGPVATDQHRLPAVDTTFRTEVGRPPIAEEGQEDELELMELDEPDLNDDEVLSQIACLRGADGSGPDSDAVPWSHGSVTAVPGSCGGETAALLSGWSPQPAAPPTPAPAERLLTVVIDTNVLIHGVGFVLDLRDSFVEGLRPLLLVPWVVVQELDRLKQDGRRQPGQDVTVSSKARAAISFLLECFQARHPSVRGQTAAEAAAARRPLEGRVADDAILECCLAAGQQGDVLLLSDDKNLLTKVLLHGLAGASRQQLLQATDLCGVTEDLQVTEENQILFAKIILRKLLSYVIRREMSLAYGAAWHALPGVRRPWWSLRDLVSVVCGQRAVFRTVFAGRWHHWQQLFKLATRPVLSAAERCSLCAGVSELLPLLQPSDHYLPLVRPLSAALRTGAALPAGPLAALGTSLGGQRTAVSHTDQEGGRQGDPDAPPAAEKTPSLADVIRQQNREAARTAEDRSAGTTAPGPPQNGLTPPEDTADRTAAGTPPPPDDDDAVMGSAGGPGELDPTAVLDLFQSVWNYVNTCCGLLLDAAGVPHPYQYERPAAPPTPDECAAFLPELGTAVQMLAITLKSLMGVSVVALVSDDGPLVAACHALHAVVALAGQETTLTPQQLLRFLRSPANRLLLGKGLEQLTGFLKTLEELHQMVS